MQTLKKNGDFKRVYENGKSYADRYLVLYVLKNNKNYNRTGFSISKKIGKAVSRNKIRRRLKEIIRLNEQHHIKKGYDLILIARKPITGINFSGMRKSLINLLKKAGIWIK